jgi:hypothetical protein
MSAKLAGIEVALTLLFFGAAVGYAKLTRRGG